MGSDLQDLCAVLYLGSFGHHPRLPSSVGLQRGKQQAEESQKAE